MSSVASRRGHLLEVWLGKGSDPIVLALLLIGFAALYVPTYWSLAHSVWSTDEQGHGPIILAVSIWLLYRKRHELTLVSVNPAYLSGFLILAASLGMYSVGRSQGILIFEVGSQIVMISALLLIFKGYRAWRLALFPLFFLIFMVPLPGPLVSAVTTPLKSAVSAVATFNLYFLGYPVGRSGVVLTVGQYQLLVADACAGLNSMFTLEALGLLYMNLMGYASLARNVTLAMLIIPISFVANVVRVMILVLVTYHLGDEAGQGFVHGFAGMVLFLVALALMLIVDGALGLIFNPSSRKGQDAAS